MKSRMAFWKCPGHPPNSVPDNFCGVGVPFGTVAIKWIALKVDLGHYHVRPLILFGCAFQDIIVHMRKVWICTRTFEKESALDAKFGVVRVKNKKFGTDVALVISDIEIFFQTSYGCTS